MISLILVMAVAACAPATVVNRSDVAESARRQQPPNIIFVFADDHAAHAVSAYGSRINSTPNIDRLAAGGMLFENAFVTNAICAPSRATVLTGQFGHLNGVQTNREPLHPTEYTFPKLLKAAGYETAVIGKWHLKVTPEGFSHVEVLQGQGPYYNPTLVSPTDTVRHVGYTPDIITDRALAWLDASRGNGKPFLLMLQHQATHRWWDPGPEHHHLFGGEPVPEPATLFDDYEGRTSATQTQEMMIAADLTERDLKLETPADLTEQQLAAWNAAYQEENDAFRRTAPQDADLVRWKYQRYIKDYLKCVAAIDDNLGRLLDYLEESGLADNTVVIYTSDQGFFLGDHGWFDKRWMYEESLRTPLIVRWPGHAEPGSRNRDLVQNLDLAQTFLQMARVDAPPTMQGASLVPLLEGETPDDWRDAIYYQYFEFPGWHMVRRHYGVRTRRHKLIHYYEIDEWELFDLRADPDELKSVYEDASYEAVREQLRKRLYELREQYAVPEIDTVPYVDFPLQRRGR